MAMSEETMGRAMKITTVILLFFLSGCASLDHATGHPRVLLVGDSISRGYTIPVRELLCDEADVYRAPSHPAPTTEPTSIKDFSYIDEYLGHEKWDVIHFNYGFPALWLGEDGKNRIPLDAYENNLKRLVARLKKTNAKLIWASTTPVPTGILNPIPEDVAKYNATAEHFMAENNIPICDLYTFVLPRTPDIQIKDNLHFTPKGYEALADEVAASIRNALSR
jgi:hypothetical protein